MKGSRSATRCWAAILLVALIALGPAVRAQEAPAPPTPRNLELVGQVGGTTEDVAVQGSYVYAGQGSRLAVLDVSDPTRPKVVGRSTPRGDEVQRVVAAGEHVYVAVEGPNEGRGGMQVVRVSDPTNPTEVAFFPTPGRWAPELTVAGPYAYLNAQGDSIVLDVSDPAAPVEVARGVLPPGDVVVVGQYAYVSSGRLRIFDLSDPLHPTQLGELAGLPAENLAVAGRFAYLAGEREGLRVVDVSDPASPTVVARVMGQLGETRGITIVGRYAYLTHPFAGLLIVVDLSDPTQPRIVGSAETGSGPPQRVAVAGGKAYVAADSGGLRIFDVARPERPAEVGAYEAPGHRTGTLSVAVADGHAYVADLANGLHVIDVSDPTRPDSVGLYRDDAEAVRVAVAGRYAYLMESGLRAPDGLRVLDVSDPSRPTRVVTLELPVGDLALAGSYAYLAQGSRLQIFDLSDPTRPRQVGVFDPPPDEALRDRTNYDVGARVAVAGRFAYVAFVTRFPHPNKNLPPIESAQHSGLRVLDVSNPAAPTEVGVYRLAWSPTAVAAIGSFVYVLAYRVGPEKLDGLRIFDVAEPSNPSLAASFPMGAGHFSSSIALDGRYAYLASDGLRVLDVADPARPVEVGFYPVFLNSVAAAGGYAYIGTGSEGLQILRLTGGAPP